MLVVVRSTGRHWLLLATTYKCLKEFTNADTLLCMLPPKTASEMPDGTARAAQVTDDKMHQTP